MFSAPNSAVPADAESTPDKQRHAGFWAMALGSIGVVYGDIGTSPLYAMREALIRTQEGGIDRGELMFCS